MASKQSASTSTFIVKEQGPMPQLQNTAHGKSDVITSSTPNPAPSYAVPQICDRCSRIDISFCRIQKNVSDGGDKEVS